MIFGQIKQLEQQLDSREELAKGGQLQGQSRSTTYLNRKSALDI